MPSEQPKVNSQEEFSYYDLVEAVINVTPDSLNDLKVILDRFKENFSEDEYKEAIREGVNRSLIELSADSCFNLNDDFTLDDQINLIKDMEKRLNIDHSLILEGVRGALNYHAKRGPMNGNDGYNTSKVIAEKFDLVDYWGTQWEVEKK